jgi:acyl carrier protein
MLKDIVADCLGITVAEVTDDKRLFLDLGADSLDFADLIHRLEQEFSVSLGLETVLQLDLADPNIMQGEYLTADAVNMLCNALPGVVPENSEKAKLTDLISLITVGTMRRLIEQCGVG